MPIRFQLFIPCSVSMALLLGCDGRERPGAAAARPDSMAAVARADSVRRAYEDSVRQERNDSMARAEERQAKAVRRAAMLHQGPCYRKMTLVYDQLGEPDRQQQYTVSSGMTSVTWFYSLSSGKAMFTFDWGGARGGCEVSTMTGN